MSFANRLQGRLGSESKVQWKVHFCAFSWSENIFMALKSISIAISAIDMLENRSISKETFDDDLEFLTISIEYCRKLEK